MTTIAKNLSLTARLTVTEAIRSTVRDDKILTADELRTQVAPVLDKFGVSADEVPALIDGILNSFKDGSKLDPEARIELAALSEGFKLGNTQGSGPVGSAVTAGGDPNRSTGASLDPAGTLPESDRGKATAAALSLYQLALGNFAKDAETPEAPRRVLDAPLVAKTLEGLTEPAAERVKQTVLAALTDEQGKPRFEVAPGKSQELAAALAVLRMSVEHFATADDAMAALRGLSHNQLMSVGYRMTSGSYQYDPSVTKSVMVESYARRAAGTGQLGELARVASEVRAKIPPLQTRLPRPATVHQIEMRANVASLEEGLRELTRAGMGWVAVRMGEPELIPSIDSVGQADAAKNLVGHFQANGKLRELALVANRAQAELSGKLPIPIELPVPRLAARINSLNRNQLNEMLRLADLDLDELNAPTILQVALRVAIDAAAGDRLASLEASIAQAIAAHPGNPEDRAMGPSVSRQLRALSMNQLEQVARRMGGPFAALSHEGGRAGYRWRLLNLSTDDGLISKLGTVAEAVQREVPRAPTPFPPRLGFPNRPANADRASLVSALEGLDRDQLEWIARRLGTRLDDIAGDSPMADIAYAAARYFESKTQSAQLAAVLASAPAELDGTAMAQLDERLSLASRLYRLGDEKLSQVLEAMELDGDDVLSSTRLGVALSVVDQSGARDPNGLQRLTTAVAAAELPQAGRTPAG